MSNTMLLVNEANMNRYPSQSTTQLPSLNSVLTKIQSEQKWPLPNPTGTRTIALPSTQNILQPYVDASARPDHDFPRKMPSFGYSEAAFQPPSSVTLPTPLASPKPTKQPDSISPVRRYRCKVCTKMFTTSGHLARHTRIHTGVKNHLCPHEGCGARFSRQDNCMQHYKTHLNTKKTRKRGKSM